MSGSPSAPKDKTLPTEEASEAAAIVDYLRKHPDFLIHNPELLDTLTPPEHKHGDGVVDMQTFILKAQRADVENLKAREAALLDAAQANATVQARIFSAVQKILAARSFEHLIGIINDELPEMLALESVALAVESGNKLPGKSEAAGVVVLKPKIVNILIDTGRDVELLTDHAGDPMLFGTDAGAVRSVALLRLKFGAGAPPGLLALGSAEVDGFDPNQGTELLSFMARVLERCIKRWLGLTS